MLGCVRGLCTSRASGTNAPACAGGPTTCMPAAFGRLASTPRVAPMPRGRCRSPGFDPPSGTHALAFPPRPSCQEVKKMHGGGILTGAHARAAKAKAKEASPGKPKRTAASPKAAAPSPAKVGKGGQQRLVFATPPRAARERASPPVSPSLAQAETQLEGTGPQEDAPQQQASGQAAAALALPAPAPPRPTGPSTTPGEPVGGTAAAESTPAPPSPLPPAKKPPGSAQKIRQAKKAPEAKAATGRRTGPPQSGSASASGGGASLAASSSGRGDSSGRGASGRGRGRGGEGKRKTVEARSRASWHVLWWPGALLAVVLAHARPYGGPAQRRRNR
jgi:hypothetical protein